MKATKTGGEIRRLLLAEVARQLTHQREADQLNVHVYSRRAANDANWTADYALWGPIKSSSDEIRAAWSAAVAQVSSEFDIIRRS
jgi:hypothetical protein